MRFFIAPFGAPVLSVLVFMCVWTVIRFVKAFLEVGQEKKK